MQCQHVNSDHCGRCAYFMNKSEGLTHTKEHKKIKSRGDYMQISPDDMRLLINKGMRVNSRTYGHVLPN